MPDLASIVGPGHVTASHTAQAVAPATTAELTEVLRAANADGLTVVPTSGGTKLDWGNPVEPEILLSTERLSGVYEHAWADLTATVGAGTTWVELQTVVARNGQRVALDPLFPARATVGGILATNDSGALRARFGSLRDLVLGMTIVLADGTVARTGGKVVKNVAGYDLPKLLTGSFGTLGIITEATFRLHPLPIAQASFTLRSPDASALGELMKRLYAAHLSIERCQFRSEKWATNRRASRSMWSWPRSPKRSKNRRVACSNLGQAVSPNPRMKQLGKSVKRSSQTRTPPSLSSPRSRHACPRSSPASRRSRKCPASQRSASPSPPASPPAPSRSTVRKHDKRISRCLSFHL